MTRDEEEFSERLEQFYVSNFKDIDLIDYLIKIEDPKIAKLFQQFQLEYNILVFNIINKIKTTMNIKQIARTCHEVNKAFCESIGDYSQPKWEDAPEWQKESAINGVEFHLSNPDSKPSDSHNNWMAEKIKDGWVYGPVKNPDTKEHPCMVPYEELPKEQQTKDSLFIAVVRSFE